MPSTRRTARSGATSSKTEDRVGGAAAQRCLQDDGGLLWVSDKERGLDIMQIQKLGALSYYTCCSTTRSLLRAMREANLFCE